MTHYHECGASCCSIPENNYAVWGGGGQYAHSGQAYLDMVMSFANDEIPNHFNEGNFLGTPLFDSLTQGKKYEVEFYLSLWDSVWYAGRNIGVHFSSGQPDGDIDNLLSLVPQVRYEGDFLTDKEEWMKVSGSFIAQGGEDYITIGNFDGYHGSESLLVGGAIPPPNLPHYWKLAAYYIDDVSVVEDRNIGIGEASISHFNVYPNPAHDMVSVEAEYGRQVTLYDMAGRSVLSVAVLSSKETIGIGHLPMGVYAVGVEMQDGSVARKRLVKQ